jgi:urease accessory protein
MPYRSTQILSPGPADKTPLHTIALAHDQRHLRRKLLHLDNDDVVMLDLKEAVMLADGDLLVLDTGDYVRIAATEETLYDIRPRDPLHLIELAWHLGNRHLPAEIRPDRILILRDPVIKAMLEGLGATVAEVTEPFQPMRGAYHGSGGHSHGHAHGHGSHHHAHD